MKSNRYICIIYDSITNSVFESQVLAPIQQKLLIDPQQEWHLISCEPSTITPPSFDPIRVHLYKRSPYICHLSLCGAITYVKKICATYDNYHIIARGPIAGYIASKAQTTACQSITIQARGLLAQEYAFVHQQKYNLFHRLRTYLFTRLEQSIYKTNDPLIKIEAVSPALRSYLIATYHTDAHRIHIAQNDLPKPITTHNQTLWRLAIRTKLNITNKTLVYCYSGSYKPWQCPQETLLFFKQTHKNMQDTFLLILTPDIEQFKKLAEKIELSLSSYTICSVKQKELYTYLTACDIGILFRTKHIINSTSRPTKALEYYTARLQILHNGTVDFITDMPELQAAARYYNGFDQLQADMQCKL